MNAIACHCEACEMDVTALRPSRWWKVANVGVWSFIVVVGPFLVVMPPLNLVTVPIFTFAALAMVGYVSDKLGQAPSCPRCGRDVVHSDHAQGDGDGSVANVSYLPSRRNSPGVLPVQRTKAL